MNLLLVLPDFADPGVWISLVTLCFLEVVLGIDNVIFISIVAGKLPQNQQAKARNIGLMLAMVFRVCLLLTINWIISLKDPVVHIPPVFDKSAEPLGLSWKDLILLAGGIFLIAKSTMEIHHKLQMEDPSEAASAKKGAGFLAIV